MDYYKKEAIVQISRRSTVANQDTRKMLIDARDKRGWDNKDWHRAVGVDQRVLEGIDAGLIDISAPELKDLADLIYLGTNQNELPEMLRFEKPQVIAFDIHKGGGGKTTLSVNIACELGRRGYNVLVIDADSQGDSTTTILPNETPENAAAENSYTKQIEKKNLFACLNSDFLTMDIRDHIISSQYDGLDIVASNTNLSKMDVMLSAMDFREQMFARALEGLIQENYYDFVFVDMDKNIGLMNTTILCGCDYIMIPCECEMFHLKGLFVMDIQIEKVKRYNPKLKILGIVFNKVNMRKRSYEEARAAASSKFGNVVFDNMLRVDANIGNSQFEGQPVIVYNRSCRASQEIRSIADEMLDRLKKEGE